MKKQLLTFFIALTTFVGWGQNLVPNGDFEQYTTCPTSFNQLDSALFWFNPTVTSPDYYNQCSSSSIVSVPVNWTGNNYLPAHSGAAYAGIYLYFWTINGPEYIEVPLTSPLISNTCYHFEMYISLADPSQYTTDDIGIYFSDTLVTSTNYTPLPFIPQLVNAPGNYPDTSGWTLVSGNYTVNGGESYIIIGNFKNDSATNLVLVNNNGDSIVYFFIDDVSLTPCSTGINETANNNSTFTISPNPAGDYLEIRNSKPEIRNNEIKIYDMMGKEVLKSTINFQSSIINIQSLKTGIYFIEINGLRKKFVKQ